MQTPTGPLAHLDQDEEPATDPHAGRGWTTTLRRTLLPQLGARENAHEALLECRVHSAQRCELAQGLVPAPRAPVD